MLSKTTLTLACLLFALSSDAVMLDDNCCGCHLSPCGDSHCDEEQEEKGGEEENNGGEEENGGEVPTSGGEPDVNTVTDMPPDNCCWYFKDPNFKREVESDMTEVCITHNIFGQELPNAKSFVYTDFDDNMESVKCGALAQAEICG